MINYFLELDSNIESVLEENSIEFHSLNIGGTNGIILTQSGIYSLNRILNESFEKDIDINYVRDTDYVGIKQVFISDYGDDEEDGYESYNDNVPWRDRVEELSDQENFNLSKELIDINKEIDEVQKELNELKERRKFIENKIKRTDLKTEKEAQPVVLFDYAEEIIL